MVKTILTESGHESDFVKLTDLGFSGCRGCVDLCAGPRLCMLDDDLLPHYRAIKEADAVVIGSPVYFGSINGTTVAFLERFFGFRHVEIAVKDKPFVLVLGGHSFCESAKKSFFDRLKPFEVNILEVVEYSSTIFPCYSCGLHRGCSIGGLYRTIGEEAFNVEIEPEMFQAWEDDPDTVAAVQAAAARLQDL